MGHLNPRELGVEDGNPIGDSKIRELCFLDGTLKFPMVAVHGVQERQRSDSSVRFSSSSHKLAREWKRRRNHVRSHLSVKHGKLSIG